MFEGSERIDMVCDVPAGVEAVEKESVRCELEGLYDKWWNHDDRPWIRWETELENYSYSYWKVTVYQTTLEGNLIVSMEGAMAR